MSLESIWSKAGLSGFLSSASVLRDEDAPFFLVYRGCLSGSNSGESQQIPKNLYVLVDQLDLQVRRFSGLESKSTARILLLAA